jgi:small subunit ribosomal protein S21
LVHVVVRDNDVDRALRVFKKALQNDGFFKKMRLMRCHETKSAKRTRKTEEAVRRLRKAQRKSVERSGPSYRGRG